MDANMAKWHRCYFHKLLWSIVNTHCLNSTRQTVKTLDNPRLDLDVCFSVTLVDRGRPCEWWRWCWSRRVRWRPRRCSFPPHPSPHPSQSTRDGTLKGNQGMTRHLILKNLFTKSIVLYTSQTADSMQSRKNISLTKEDTYYKLSSPPPLKKPLS